MCITKFNIFVKHLTRKTLVKDDEGRELPALDIFSMVIKYLKEHLLETLETRGTGLDNNDIHWVLTVPAIWSEPAKQFMREAAEKVYHVLLNLPTVLLKVENVVVKYGTTLLMLMVRCSPRVQYIVGSSLTWVKQKTIKYVFAPSPLYPHC